MAEEHQAPDGPTYKVIAYGACGIIFALLGWWATDVKSTVERFRLDDLEPLKQRTTKLETGSISDALKIERLERDTVDLAIRLRELEKTIMERSPRIH